MKINIQKKIIISCIFISMLILNFITPLIMDDFNYTYGLNGRINSIKDIFNYQIWFYFNWGGRNVAHFIAQFFLMRNKILFNFMNSAIYTIMIYLIYEIIKNGKNEYPIFLILIHLGLWFFTPAYGQSFLWLTGSCNYLWTTTIILLFLYLFNKFNNEKKYCAWKAALFGILGIMSGWTNENSGASIIIMLAIYMFIKKYIEKKKINKIQIIGLIGVIIGFTIMITAPGNFERSKTYKNSTFFLISWLQNFMKISKNGTNNVLFLIILLVILCSYYIHKRQTINKKILIFLIGALVATYSMMVSPTFPERSWTIVIVYMIIACGILLYNLKLNITLKKIIILAGVNISIFIFIGSYMLTLEDSYKFFKVWKGRIETIEKGKKQGKQDYEFDVYLTSRKQSASFGLEDLFEGKNDANNKTFARYFGIDSIQSTKK